MKTASFWYMTDMHTFIKPTGKTLKEIKDSLLDIAEEHPYGMICPVIIIDEDGKEDGKRIGESCHTDKNGRVKRRDIREWYKQVSKKLKTEEFILN